MELDAHRSAADRERTWIYTGNGWAALDIVTLPPTLMQTTAQSNQQLQVNSVFTGTFMVKEIRHIGNSRGTDANAWATVLTLVNTASPGN